MAAKRKIPAYLVFSGGGIRGLALAGALDQLTKLDFEPQAYGGTSAGAIVACLASAGLNGLAQRNATLAAKSGGANPAAIFAGTGSRLPDLLSALEKLAPTLKVAPGKSPSALGIGWTALRLKSGQKGAISELFGTWGVVELDALRKPLATLLAQKLRLPPDRTIDSVRFDEWVKFGARPLKVVASNLSDGNPVVFSAADTPTAHVLDAVVASAAFPFVFRPARLQLDGVTDDHLVDGGLASNSPAFLFREESNIDRIPTIVVQFSRPISTPGNFGAYVLSVIDTAVNAGDRIIADMIPNSIIVDIHGAEGAPVIATNTTDDHLNTLYKQGVNAAKRVADRTSYRRLAGTAAYPDGVTDLGMRYGDPEPFLSSLFAMRLQLYSAMAARAQQPLKFPMSGVRTALFLPRDRQSASWAIGMSLGFGSDKDINIEFLEGEGCVGQAVEERRVTFDESKRRRVSAKRRSAARLRAEHFKLVPKDRDAVLAIPVLQYREASSRRGDRPLVAVITLDTPASLADSMWAGRRNEASPLEPYEYIIKIVNGWSGIFARLLAA
jgi:predicted acylesterase/phospholipase RssA